ncbi:MAG TPA: metal-dependent hydrolase [Pyrinomonadaceae bacterium]|nr:metal-dependent hydrolase [Pyrinomonadaceae bacterium]
MDNLTHSLVGLAAAKAGLERTSPCATAVCVVAANLPDSDIVALAWGRAAYLEHHRGITHSLVGTLALGLFLPVVVFAAERAWARARGREARARLRGLLLSSLALSASHPLLDWTNNYGLRPWLPWDNSWIYGDLVFILDPWIWLLVGGAVFLAGATSRARKIAWGALALLVTVVLLVAPRRFGMEIPFGVYAVWFAALAVLVALHLSRLPARWGRRVPAAALALLVLYWCALAVFHARAAAAAQVAAASLAAERGAGGVLRVAAMPTFASPLSWRCAAETERATLRFDLSLGSGVGPGAVGNVLKLDKPSGADETAVLRASQNEHARVLLDFARFPVSTVRRDDAGRLLVQFVDLRFTEPSRQAPRGGSFALEVPVE